MEYLSNFRNGSRIFESDFLGKLPKLFKELRHLFVNEFYVPLPVEAVHKLYQPKNQVYCPLSSFHISSYLADFPPRSKHHISKMPKISSMTSMIRISQLVTDVFQFIFGSKIFQCLQLALLYSVLEIFAIGIASFLLKPPFIFLMWVNLLRP